jgi:hypothetical protein
MSEIQSELLNIGVTEFSRIFVCPFHVKKGLFGGDIYVKSPRQTTAWRL